MNEDNFWQIIGESTFVDSERDSEIRVLQRRDIFWRGLLQNIDANDYGTVEATERLIEQSLGEAEEESLLRAKKRVRSGSNRLSIDVRGRKGYGM